MTDVFLSYTSKDRPLAQRIEAALGRQGVSVFWDQEVPPGRDWDEWIRAKLTEARLVVVLWTKASVASPNVRHEAMIARDAKKLVPVLAEDLQPSDFPMGLYMVQALKLDGWSGDAADPRYKRLETEVLARLGRPARTAPPGTKLAQAEAKAEAAMQRAKAGFPIALLGGVGAALAIGLGLYALDNRPASVAPQAAPITEPAPAPPPAPAPTAVDTVLGRWDWGRGCGDASVVTREGEGKLVFTTAATRFVHEIGAVGAGEVKTVVTEPEDFAGDVYKLAANGATLTVEQLAPNKETNTWTRCP
jgi:hypothetical protein